MKASRTLTVTTFQSELRSPLKTILEMVEGLSKSVLTKEQREYVDHIFSSAHRLVSLADYLSSESSKPSGFCFEMLTTGIKFPHRTVEPSLSSHRYSGLDPI